MCDIIRSLLSGATSHSCLESNRRSGGLMATTTEKRTYEEAVNWLRDHGFDILEAPGTKNRVFLKKSSVSAAIERGDDGAARLFAKPGRPDRR